MKPNRHLKKIISEETGVDFETSDGIDTEGRRWYLLRPLGLPHDQSFAIRVVIDWRRLRIGFEPGKFAGELLAYMGNADADGRRAFRAILADCIEQGAKIDIQVNGTEVSFESGEIWDQAWDRFVLSMSKGQLDLGGGASDIPTICLWTGRFAAAIMAILPIEESASVGSDIAGYPEGALTEIKTNRYERDRRNRAAAIAIHGTSCKGCGIDMGIRYGEVAEGFIEIHHITPVSQLGEKYVIDPAHDLVPLCPNCHAIVHRRIPPYSVDEIRRLLEQG